MPSSFYGVKLNVRYASKGKGGLRRNTAVFKPFTLLLNPWEENPRSILTTASVGLRRGVSEVRTCQKASIPVCMLLDDGSCPCKTPPDRRLKLHAQCIRRSLRIHNAILHRLRTHHTIRNGTPILCGGITPSQNPRIPRRHYILLGRYRLCKPKHAHRFGILPRCIRGKRCRLTAHQSTEPRQTQKPPKSNNTEDAKRYDPYRSHPTLLVQSEPPVYRA